MPDAPSVYECNKTHLRKLHVLLTVANAGSNAGDETTQDGIILLVSLVIIPAFGVPNLTLTIGNREASLLHRMNLLSSMCDQKR